jgi:L-cystine uptake protein TcyP (sodium:dicarboxylate symporter family)
MLTACKLGLAGSDASACSLACLPFPSALLSMLIPVKPIAELLSTTHHWAFQIVHDDISNGMLSSKFKSSQFLNRST